MGNETSCSEYGTKCLEIVTEPKEIRTEPEQKKIDIVDSLDLKRNRGPISGQKKTKIKCQSDYSQDLEESSASRSLFHVENLNLWSEKSENGPQIQAHAGKNFEMGEKQAAVDLEQIQEESKGDPHGREALPVEPAEQKIDFSQKRQKEEIKKNDTKSHLKKLETL